MLLHVVDTYQIRISPQYIFIQILRILYVALRVLNQTGTQLLRNEHVARNEYFVTCAVRGYRSGDVTNFQPIRCAFALFHFGRIRAVYVATRIILLSSTAERSATSGT